MQCDNFSLEIRKVNVNWTLQILTTWSLISTYMLIKGFQFKCTIYNQDDGQGWQVYYEDNLPVFKSYN